MCQMNIGDSMVIQQMYCFVLDHSLVKVGIIHYLKIQSNEKLDTKDTYAQDETLLRVASIKEFQLINDLSVLIQ